MEEEQQKQQKQRRQQQQHHHQGWRHHLETNKADKAVWLMKCPPNLAKSLGPDPDAATASDPCFSGPVAKVVLTVDPLNSNNETKFTMELAASTDSENTPKLYILDMSKDFVPMSVFSESSEGKLSVEGKIKNKFDMKPHHETFENYGKICRERTDKYKKCRKIKVIENDNGRRMIPLPGGPCPPIPAHSDKRKAQSKGSETKRTRRDRGEMEDIMFKMFERQPNWTLKQLIQETDQPEQFLKDILKELSIYNNKGANQGTYELKPEYRETNEKPAPQ